jgi:glycosyltransferase involved in cell wall biosynthesis
MRNDFESKKMRILFVSQYFYPETFRGNDIVFDLIKKGHEVTVLTGKPNYPQGSFYPGYRFWGIQYETINGANVIRIPVYPRRNGKGINLILNYISFFLFSYPYCRYKIKESFDIIFVQQLSPITMALPAIWIKNKKINQHAKLYLWVLDLWPESIIAVTGLRNKFILSILKKLSRFIYAKVDYILISSISFTKSIEQYVKEKTFMYFPNWAESIFENNADALIEPSVEFPSGFNITFAGNVGEAQDFETVLKAAELTKGMPINWNIIGDGRKKDWIKKYICTHKLENVYLYDRFPLETMPYFFDKSDVMLVTLGNSPVFELTVPAKLQAYLASKKIILAAINGEAYDIINNNGVGKACHAGDFKALAENAMQLLNISNSERNEIEQRALLLYNTKFSKKKLLDDLVKHFKMSLHD